MAHPISTTTSSHNQPKVLLVSLSLVAFLALAGILILILQVNEPRINVDVKRAEERSKTLRELQVKAQEDLTKPLWIDREKGIVRLPIHLAMELIIKELQTKPVTTGQVAQPIPTSIVSPALQPKQDALPQPSGTSASNAIR